MIHPNCTRQGSGMWEILARDKSLCFVNCQINNDNNPLIRNLIACCTKGRAPKTGVVKQPHQLKSIALKKQGVKVCRMIESRR